MIRSRFELWVSKSGSGVGEHPNPAVREGAWISNVLVIGEPGSFLAALSIPAITSPGNL